MKGRAILLFGLIALSIFIGEAIESPQPVISTSGVGESHMATITVSDAKSLLNALNAAKGGDTIKLAAGNYGDIAITDKKFSSAVTIVSADISNPAHLDRLILSGSSNLTFKSLDVGRALKTGEANSKWNALVVANQSTSIVIDSSKIHVPTVSANMPMGVFTSNATGIRLSNNDIYQVSAGSGFDHSQNIEVINNKYHEIHMSDGIDLSQVNNVTLDGNQFYDFRAEYGSYHPDAIQFWTTNTTASSTNIEIKNNVIRQGTGLGLQAIFITDPVGNLPYKNINIQNNFIYIAEGYHGIALDHAENASITGNTVISPSSSTQKEMISISRIASGTLSSNIADQINVKTSDNVIQSNNLQTSSKSILQSFSTALKGDLNTITSKFLMPGIGYQPPSAVTAPTSTPGSSTSEPSSNIVVSPITTPPTQTPPATTPTSTATPITAPLLLGINFDGGVIKDSSNYNSQFIANYSKDDIVNTEKGAAFHLAAKSYFGTQRFTDKQLFSLEKFTLSFALKRDKVDGVSGEIMRIQNNWRLYLNRNSQLVFEINDKNNQTSSYVVSGANLADTNWHDIDLSFDATAKTVSFYIDSKQVGQTAISTATRAQEYWGLSIGNPYASGESVKGLIGAISVRGGALTGQQIASEGGWSTGAQMLANTSTTQQPVTQAAVTSASQAQTQMSFAPTTLASSLAATQPAYSAPLTGAQPTSAAQLPAFRNPLTSNLARLFHA